MSQKVFNGNNIELLKEYPDNYFDAIVTDPPYGLGKEPNAEQMLQAWITDGYLEVKGSGFMGKEWDAFVPQPIFWKEVFRVLKHGGHVLSFFGTRTYDWGVMAMRLAGFEVRDCIQWVYGSGFPKSHNIGKAVDKFRGNEREEIEGGKIASTLGSNTMDGGKANSEYRYTKGNSEWEGWGSALKPANEPIVLARKPLEKGLSIAENVLKWGTGGINIDGCRVGYKEDDHVLKYEGYSNGKYQSEYEQGTSYKHGNQVQINKQGRFPANFIMTHHPDCFCVGTKKVKAIKGGMGENSMGGMGKNGIYGKYSLDKLGANAGGLGDENGEETIENWNCHEDCPIRIMDEQSGDRKGWASQNHNNFSPYGGNSFNASETNRIGFHKGYDDKGGASRFFYCAKASKKERNKGLNEFEEKIIKGRDEGQDKLSVAYKPRPTPMANVHPTVKPISLMRYLVRLITPPNGIVLDPFNGSGTTGIACKLEGMNYVGMELDAEYCKIAQARIDNFTESDLEYEVEELNEDAQTNESEQKDNEDDNLDTQLSLF